MAKKPEDDIVVLADKASAKQFSEQETFATEPKKEFQVKEADIEDPNDLRRLTGRLERAKNAQERAEIYGSVLEESLLRTMPSVEELRKEAANSHHVVTEGLNRLNARAQKVKVIRDMGGEAVTVDFVSFREKNYEEYKRKKGILDDPAIERKKKIRSQAKYDFDE